MQDIKDLNLELRLIFLVMSSTLIYTTLKKLKEYHKFDLHIIKIVNASLDFTFD